MFGIQKLLDVHLKKVHKNDNKNIDGKIQTKSVKKMSILEGEDFVEYQLPYGWKKVVRRVPNNHIWDVYVYGHNGSNEKPYRICSFPPVVKIMIQEYIHIKSMNDNRNYFF